MSIRVAGAIDPGKLKEGNLMFLGLPSRMTGLSNNQPVAVFEDFSGKGNQLSQPTTSKQALYKTDPLRFNNKAFLRFDGIDDEYIHNTFSLSSPGSVFIVKKAVNKTVSIVQTPMMHFWTSSGAVMRINPTTSSTQGNGSYTTLGASFANRDLCVFAGSNPARTIFTSGYKRSLSTEGIHTVPSGLKVGNGNIGYYDGDIALLAIYEGAISEKSINGLMKYALLMMGTEYLL